MTNSRHNMQSASVLTLNREQQAEDEIRAKAEEVQAFDALYAEYLSVSAKWAHGVPDDESDRLIAKQCDLVWKIIRTPAPLHHYIDLKLEVLREIMQTEWTDCRREALLESIRNDVGEP